QGARAGRPGSPHRRGASSHLQALPRTARVRLRLAPLLRTLLGRAPRCARRALRSGPQAERQARMTQKHAPTAAVRLERLIPAPPREVYDAWLDPALLLRWMAPGFDVTRAEVDARVGGH